MHDTRRTRLVLAVLLVVAIGLITLDHRGFGPLVRLRSVAAGLFGPAERLASYVTRPVTGFIEAVVGAPAARHKILTLEEENQRLRTQLSGAQLSQTDAAQLDRLLQLAGRGGYRVVAARVIGIGQGYEDTVTIDVGTRDGIKPDQTVVNQDGLVGRVTAAGPYASTVLLASDASSAVGCRLEGSNEIAVVRGTGKSLSTAGMLRMELFDANAVLRPGQRIVTFGEEGGHPYVPGVPIGAVTKVESTPGALTRVALVRPFVHFTTLDVVAVVVVPPRHNPRDSVLPPAPTPPAPAPQGPTPQGPTTPAPSTPTAAPAAPSAPAGPAATPSPSTSGTAPNTPYSSPTYSPGGLAAWGG